MRTKLLLTMLTLGLLAAPAGAADTWALLVGCGKFKNPVITPLKFPASDASAIRDALTDPNLGGLPADHVRLLTDDQATKAAIEGSIQDFLTPHVKPGDRVIVYLASHGVAKGVGVQAKSYFLPTDVDGLTVPALETSAVNLKGLSDELGKLPASQFVIFVDACREDPVPGRGLKPNTLTDVLSQGAEVIPQDAHAESVTFFACDVGQRAYEDDQKQHGIFTYFILDALKQAPICQPPDGAVDMGRLASYVKAQVAHWSTDYSNTNSIDVEQDPTLVGPTYLVNGAATADLQAPDPVILLDLKRAPNSELVKPGPTQVTVLANSPDAQVSVDGNTVGDTPVAHPVGAGKVSLTITAPGCKPASRSVTIPDGYNEQLLVHLEPAATGAGDSAQPSKAQDPYNKAADFESRQDWDSAHAGYKIAIGADSKFAPAYERLADLQTRSGQYGSAVGTLVTMISQTPPDAHAYSLLAQAYAAFADRGAGDPDPEALPAVEANGYTVPQKPDDAAKLAVKAAQAAQAAAQTDLEKAEAERATGFALVVSGDPDHNKAAALDAFSQAIFLNSNDATAYYGRGYARRKYAEGPATKTASAGGVHLGAFGLPNPFGKKNKGNQENQNQAGPPVVDRDQVQEAVNDLQQALKLRPDYYDAHRELAYCQQLLGNTEDAHTQYVMADANRGSASDTNEVAGVNVALSCILQQEAANSQGPRQQALLSASAGYLDQAREITPNLDAALFILKRAGLGSQISNYLPGPLRDIYTKIQIGSPWELLPGGGNLPGGIHLPNF